MPVVTIAFTILPSSRSSHHRCSVKKSVLGNFAKFTGKQLCQRLFFNKVAGQGLKLIGADFPVISERKVKESAK